MVAMANSVKCLLCLILSLTICPDVVWAVHNVEHIFNAIHSSLRQWGSSLNHNGVSFFKAEIPKGVHLHHGGQKPDRVEGIEWLALEPEHAMNFAFKRCDNEHFMTEDGSRMSLKWLHQQEIMHQLPSLKSDQEIIMASNPPVHRPPMCLEPGWFHTYAPTRNLQLLYIDGTSAGKTNLGTLDSQDFVLLWNTSKEYDPMDPMGEMRRARGLCNLAQYDFEGKIDGFIRMEHGFEIILCDFSLLEVISILRSARETTGPGPIGRGELDEFFFWRAITSRYSGIGGHRVRIDYDNFVTAFAYTELDLWSDGNEQPRLDKISNATASALLNEVKQMVLSDRQPVEGRIDWQSIADMYVGRYARPIQNLNSSNFDTAEAVHEEVRRLFQPYLNKTLADRDATIKRCQEAYIPRHLVDNPNPSVAQQVIEQTAYHVCSGLYMILMDRNELELQKNHLHSLLDTLKWTTWKECQPSCDIDEICFTAIWPFGAPEDHYKPSCLNATTLRNRHGYW